MCLSILNCFSTDQQLHNCKVSKENSEYAVLKMHLVLATITKCRAACLTSPSLVKDSYLRSSQNLFTTEMFYHRAI